MIEVAGLTKAFAAKRVLFERLLRPDGHAIVNIDDDRGAALARASRGRVWSYSLENPKADLVAEALRLGLDRTRLRARTPAGTLEIESALVGRFNVQNLLAALGAGLALGLPADVVQRGLAALPGVPGRMEKVALGQDFTVLVDYAHTDDALKNLLETVRGLGLRKIRQTVEVEDTPAVRGMIKQVSYLVRVDA